MEDFWTGWDWLMFFVIPNIEESIYYGLDASVFWRATRSISFLSSLESVDSDRLAPPRRSCPCCKVHLQGLTLSSQPTIRPTPARMPCTAESELHSGAVPYLPRRWTPWTFGPRPGKWRFPLYHVKCSFFNKHDVVRANPELTQCPW